ncbi:uncharacterized protein LOC129891757 [Solanum dulcamara]|uniref:uncharacterized protein LOC129891757 n=1 Tax=Solanum dulcamara TaxID=45834 RepID=UPI0024854508|nr:uncharacterized protein LOC129891757 [Solanum dulcamara]
MVWGDLNERFNKVDGSRSYQLHREICTLHQGNLTMSEYFTKLCLLWDEFDALVLPPACNCGKSRSYVDHLQFLRLFAFLMGLNEVYSHAHSQILMINPLPSVSKAYAMITSDESQRLTAGSRISGDVHESMALYAGRSNHYMEKGPSSIMNFGRRKRPYDNTGSNSRDSMAIYSGRGGYTSAGNGNYNNSKQKKNWHLVCDYCKLHGHTKDICYRLIGYPADWKFKKKVGPGPGVMNTGREMTNHAYAERDTRDEFGPMNTG